MLQAKSQKHKQTQRKERIKQRIIKRRAPKRIKTYIVKNTCRIVKMPNGESKIFINQTNSSTWDRDCKTILQKVNSEVNNHHNTSNSENQREMECHKTLKLIYTPYYFVDCRLEYCYKLNEILSSLQWCSFYV